MNNIARFMREIMFFSVFDQGNYYVAPFALYMCESIYLRIFGGENEFCCIFKRTINVFCNAALHFLEQGRQRIVISFVFCHGNRIFARPVRQTMHFVACSLSGP